MAESHADKDAEPKAVVAKSSGHMKLVIVGAIALFVALVGAQVTVPLINRVLEGHSAGAAAPPAAEGDTAEPAAVPADDKPLAPALYVALDPPFVVSFDEEDGARYLQLQVQAMARDAATIAAVKQHSPAVRNAFLFLLSGYEIDALTTQAGKEELRQSLLEATNEIMKKNRVSTPVEDLYFTSLVVQ